MQEVALEIKTRGGRAAEMEREEVLKQEKTYIRSQRIVTRKGKSMETSQLGTRS
jgi:hypothetical protein